MIEALRAIPPRARGQRIGLLGGSFNPPHQAHRAISLYALKRLRLDAVWWLVSPGNPLKANAPQALDRRLDAARHVAAHPRIKVIAFESAVRTRYTVDTLAALVAISPGVRFVWLMGADNLAQFHRWKRWQEIARSTPFAVVDRAGQGLRALASPAACALSAYRLRDDAAARLTVYAPPAWVFLSGLKLPHASSAMRQSDGSWFIPQKTP